MAPARFSLVVGKKKKTLLDSSMVKPENVLQDKETAAASKSMLIFWFGRETADSVLARCSHDENVLFPPSL